MHVFIYVGVLGQREFEVEQFARARSELGSELVLIKGILPDEDVNNDNLSALSRNISGVVIPTPNWVKILFLN